MTNIKEVSPRPILLVAGENAHSRYYSEDAYAAAYLVCRTFYVDGPRGLEWYSNYEVLVFSRGAADGGFTGLLGRMDYEDRMGEMDAGEIIREAVGE